MKLNSISFIFIFRKTETRNDRQASSMESFEKIEKAEHSDSIPTGSDIGENKNEGDFDEENSVGKNSSLAETAEAFLNLPERYFKLQNYPSNKRIGAIPCDICENYIWFQDNDRLESLEHYMFDFGEDCKLKRESGRMTEDELNSQKLCCALYSEEYHRAVISKPPGEAKNSSFKFL